MPAPQRIIGQEAELFTLEPARRSGIPEEERRELVHALGRLVASRVPAVADCATEQGGQYLASGAKFYCETFGRALELATPECLTPRAAVVAARALEELAVWAAASFRQETGRELQLFKSSRNPHPRNRATIGSHESYLACHSSSELAELLAPFLVSREMLSGGGGLSTETGRPCLSQRAEFILHDTGYCASGQNASRAVVELKDEPLAPEGWRRVHLTFAAHSRTDASLYQRLGSTAAVILWADGVLDGRCKAPRVSRLRCPEPAAKLRELARDGIGARVPVARDGTGGWLDALAVQRRYLHACAQLMGRTEVPDWYAGVIESWERVLKLLVRGGPPAVAPLLDWALRCRLFEQVLTRRGASWDDARPGSELHEELLLRDFLWGALGEADVVRALEREGEVWRMTTDREVVRAIHRPPVDAAPRAHARGELIRGIVERGEREHWEAGWTVLLHRAQDRAFHLPDPFARQALPGSRAQAVPETLLRRSDRRRSGRLFGGLG